MISKISKCDKQEGQYFPKCDNTGCKRNAYDVNNLGMCPDAGCTINTSKPFHMSHSNLWDSHGTLTNFITEFTQDGNLWQWDACDDMKYIEAMKAQAKDGFVFITSLWGAPDIDMSWLDGMTGCTGVCHLEQMSVTFENFKLTTDHRVLL